MGTVVGIDLGTTNSVVAVLKNGKPEVIPNEQGQRLTPSVVAVTKRGERLVGSPAKDQAVLNPENTIFSIKRLMGRKFKDPSVQIDMKTAPYRITEAPNGDCRVVMGGKEYSPVAISAMILQKLKIDAEAYLDEKVTDAVITVPASFNDSQRQATKDAGNIAGMNVIRVINESTAACLDYESRNKKKDITVAVFHFGGGTMDISVLEMGDGICKVKSTCGDTHLGGDDFDLSILSWLCDELKKRVGIDLRQDKMASQQVRDAAEKAKRELSTMEKTEIRVPYIAAYASGPKHMDMVLTRSKMEQLVSDLVGKSIGPCRQALQDAGLTPPQINEVLLVGGQTRTPLVQIEVAKLFGLAPGLGANADEAVARGAAIQGDILKYATTAGTWGATAGEEGSETTGETWGGTIPPTRDETTIQGGVRIDCPSCNKQTTIPDSIDTDKYDGHIVCQRCDALLQVKLVNGKVRQCIIVRDGKKRL